MNRKTLVILLVLATMVAMFAVANPASAKIGQPCPPPNSSRVCIDHDNNPDTPPIHVPPGLFRVCNDDNPRNDNKNCDKINPPGPPEAECGTAEGEVPADGPVSGIVEQIAAGIRDAGGAPLADLLDAVACDLLAPLGL